MRGEYAIDLCFIQEKQPDFELADWAEEQLERIFDGIGYWHVEAKQQEGAEVVVAEVRGIADWRDEEDAIAHLDGHTEDGFWELLQGYRIRVTAHDATACCHTGR